MLKYLVRNGQTFGTHCGRSSDTIDKKKGYAYCSNKCGNGEGKSVGGS